MKIPPGMSATVTHHLIIADRSKSGMYAIDTMLDLCPAADGCINAWHNSTDRFILFILNYNEGRVGSFTARDLEHLLSGILPELYSDPLRLPANVTFDIFVEEPDVGRIDGRIAQVLIAVALEAGFSE